MKPILLCILDGFGMRNETHGNAIKASKTPNFDYLWNNFSHSLLDASGKKVGLPFLQMGNSEVGHMNIGAGRIVYQPLEFINEAVLDGSFFTNEVLISVLNHVKENNSNLHLMGLISDGGVHSHIDHFKALLKLCKDNEVENVYLDLYTDGRDTSPTSSIEFLDELNKTMQELNIGKIATISGRFYSMDRDTRWDRVELAYDTLVNGKGVCYNNYEELINANYKEEITDEFIIPGIITPNKNIKDNDGLIFVNFRQDRATEMMTAITNPEFKEFETKKLKNIKLVTMMECLDSVIGTPAFHLEELNNILGEVLSDNNISQLRIAETEKYAHVTFFFDGGFEREYKNCDRVLIASPRVTTYDKKPEMSAYEITKKACNLIDKNKYQVIILNYANCDMVGHTGDFDATVKAVESVDDNLGVLYQKIKEKEGLLIITADHGNAEEMLNEDEEIVTSHTTSKVPFIICNKDIIVSDGKLGDIAPTLLSLLDVKIPEEMTGKILVERK